MRKEGTWGREIYFDQSGQISIPAQMHCRILCSTQMVRCDCIQHLPECKQPKVDTFSSHFLPEYVEQLNCSWYSMCVLDMNIPTTKHK
jgi:hypothetical protein